jgi:outer membrane protein assembly factor BamB
VLLATGALLLVAIVGRGVDLGRPTHPDGAVALPAAEDLDLGDPSGLLDGQDLLEDALGSSTPPACTDSAGSSCAAPFLARTEALAVTRVPFGALVVTADGVLHRLHLTDRGVHTRWQVPVQAATTSPSVDLRQAGTVAFVGTTEGVHAVRTMDGATLWSTPLPTAEAAHWTSWPAIDHVVAIAGDDVVVLDASDGEVVRSERHPHRAVVPLGTTVALLGADRITALEPRAATPRWSRPVEETTTVPPRVADAPSGPVVLQGARTRILAASDGREVLDLGARAVAARATTGSVVALVWGEETSTRLLGVRPDGSVRWEVEGPSMRCCSVQLRPTEDGAIVMAPTTPPDQGHAWVVHPATGRIDARLPRPPGVARFPVAVGRDGVVWRDGDALVGVDADGTPRWWAESGTTLLLESPLLLATTDGLIRPRVTSVLDPGPSRSPGSIGDVARTRPR